MQAAVYHGARDVRVESVPAPRDPGPGELLIAPTRAAICGTDAAEFASGPHMIHLGDPHPGSGHSGPVIIGHEFTGRVERTGAGVEGISVGDGVVSGAGVSCGECSWCRSGRTNLCAGYYTLGLSADGGLAEQVISPASICHRVPEGVADEAAAMAQPLAVAIHALDRGQVGRAESLAVIGVGGIGSFIVGAARTRGLKRLIAIDVDPKKLREAEGLGADTVIDAGAENVAAAVRKATYGEGADIVIEASGVPTSPSVAVHSARRGGRVVIVGLQGEPPPVDLFDAALREVDLLTSVAHVCDTNLPQALEVLASTDLGGRVLDRVVPLSRVVDDGLVPLAAGAIGGKVVVELPAGAS